MLKKYFVRANTSSGCVNLLDSNLIPGMNILVIGGSSKKAKSRLLSGIAGHFDSLSKNVDCIFSPFDIGSLDAVIIPSLNFAVIDSECTDKPIDTDTDTCLNFARLEADTDYLESLSQNANTAYEGLYSAYKKAKLIHDDWEKIYISNMDFARLEGYENGVIEQFVPERVSTKDAHRRNRFFGASTMDGSVNYIENITAGLNHRYFIKGRPGTGKSTFLKRLAAKCEKNGYDTEVYYCSFDKYSLDMVLVPALSLCVFDSTAPHEMFPSEERDSVLDFYTEAGLEGIDEKYERTLKFISQKYAFRIFEGTANLRLANGFIKEREFYLSRICDNDKIARLTDQIIRKIPE